MFFFNLTPLKSYGFVQNRCVTNFQFSRTKLPKYPLVSSAILKGPASAAAMLADPVSTLPGTFDEVESHNGRSNGCRRDANTAVT